MGYRHHSKRTMEKTLLVLALAAAAAAFGDIAPRFDFRAEIEARARNDGCEADVMGHFASLVSARSLPGDAFDREFDRGIRLAWVCTTIDVKRPCFAGLAACDKRACFESLSYGDGGACRFTDDDHLGFKAVEASVNQRFHRRLAERQLQEAEMARAAVSRVSAGLADVGSAVSGVSADVADVGSAVSRVDSAVAGVSAGLADVGSAVSRVDSAVAGVSAGLADVGSAVSGVSAGLADVGAELAGVSEQQVRLLATGDKMIAKQYELSSKQDRLLHRIDAVLDLVDDLFHKASGLVNAVDSLERRVTEWADNCRLIIRTISHAPTDIAVHTIEMLCLTRAAFSSERAVRTAAIGAALAVYWFAVRGIGMGFVGTVVCHGFVRSCIVSAVLVRKKSVVVVVDRQERLDGPEAALAEALKCPLPPAKCAFKTVKGAPCRNNRGCGACGGCCRHCRCH
jgi:hypothetical protein